ncbi:MAG: protease modulator HflC [Clostridiaceae bacterium]|nr:protease modulator HflC [Clostridiaceae bacterium]
MNKKKVLLISIIGLAVIILLSSSVYIVAENEYMATVRFSKIINITDKAGLHFKVPFIDGVKSFPKAVMVYDIQPSEVLTSDKQNMTIDSYVLWRITDPLLFYRSLGSIAIAEQRLDALTYNTLKNTMGTVSLTQIITEDQIGGRKKLYDDITASVQGLVPNYGIEVVDVKIKRFDLPTTNEQAVYARMISERKQMADKYLADGEYESSIIRNDTDKQVNIIISNAEAKAAVLVAEGEQEYMRRLAEAYNTLDKQEFYEFILALDALKASLEGSGKTVILGPDSPIAKALLNK